MFQMTFTGSLLAFRQFNDPSPEPEYSLVFVADGGSEVKRDGDPQSLLYTKASETVCASVKLLTPGKRYRVTCTDVGTTYMLDEDEIDAVISFSVSELVEIA